ncbi:MAG: NAD-dependent epimerase/dehydratase family protein [Chitinophagaceae bacterium]|nr:NAD-dependent epimerase/dehydratase family protein [Oligoflexus sp.]
MPKLLIAGAGYLGLALAESLRGSDTKCYLARRSPLEVEGCITVACDFTDPSTLVQLPMVESIYYAVAADSRSEEAYEKAYFIGLQNLIHHYQQRGLAPRFYLSSTTSVYAASNGERVSENERNLVSATPSRHMVRGEQLLLQSGFQGAILRYGGIYGPERTGMLRRVRDKLEVLAPNAPQYTNRIHRDDAVGIAKFLMGKPTDGMMILNAVDQEASLRDDVIRYVLKALQMKEDDYPFDLTQVSASHKRVDSTKLQSLGYRYIFPSYREGYASLLQLVKES